MKLIQFEIKLSFTEEFETKKKKAPELMEIAESLAGKGSSNKKKKKVLRIQDVLDKCSEPLIGLYLKVVCNFSNCVRNLLLLIMFISKFINIFACSRSINCPGAFGRWCQINKFCNQTVKLLVIICTFGNVRRKKVLFCHSYAIGTR